jgi:DNA-binding NarL/FixJ family response regulator
MRPRVLLADDHVIVAEGLAHVVREVGDLVGIVHNGIQLLEEARRLKPDVIVADITMPGLSGLDAMRRLRAEHSSARFIFLTIHTEPSLAAEALRAGAVGYLLKQSAGDELLDAIRAAMAGRTYLTSLLTRDVLEKVASPDDARPELTARQRDVLRLLAQGKRMKEIAAELQISPRTVEDHKYQLMQVLGLQTTAELVRFAIKQRIVD